ncbi:hypothetical protein BDZ97DRAFT_1879924 [Flammula alnicola]|nr:hypothetical protein BDZ97DRAFT_1879924 [Flammula alnicola]
MSPCSSNPFTPLSVLAHAFTVARVVLSIHGEVLLTPGRTLASSSSSSNITFNRSSTSSLAPTPSCASLYTSRIPDCATPVYTCVCRSTYAPIYPTRRSNFKLLPHVLAPACHWHIFQFQF